MIARAAAESLGCQAAGGSSLDVLMQLFKNCGARLGNLCGATNALGSRARVRLRGNHLDTALQATRCSQILRRLNENPYDHPGRWRANRDNCTVIIRWRLTRIQGDSHLNALGAVMPPTHIGNVGVPI